MDSFNKKITILNKKPTLIFKIDNFFEPEFYSEIKDFFKDINPDDLNLKVNFGKKTIYAKDLIFDNENKKKILERLNKVILSKDFFNFFVKEIFFKNVNTQSNILKKIKYLRYPVVDNKKKSFLDLFFSKISVSYAFSYIKNNGGIAPHVDSIRKYLSLMLYFPEDENKENEYGTTFWESDIKSFTNTHISDKKQIAEFKMKNKQLFKTSFNSNCLYGFLRNDTSWHTVEPQNISENYIRKSININFNYVN